MATPPVLVPLASTYAEARAGFLDAAEPARAALDGTLEHTVHPERGLEGEELAVDVLDLGPSDAAEVVLVVSATHGVEGYCGSALQQNWLRTNADALAERLGDRRLVMVHALNPYGFSWVRRVNEDNVDLNRNFLDWSKPVPDNEGYREIAELLVPADWSEAEQQRTTLELVAVVERIGLEALQAVVSSGQYHHDTGVFYGGTGPTWSNRWLHDWCAEHLGACERLTIIDVHSGLGPWGYGELICVASAGEPEHQRAEALWGKVTSMSDGGSSSAMLDGDWLTGSAALAPHAEITGIALEFGTVDPVTVLQALRADAWLHAHGDPTGPDAAAVRAGVRAAFADDDPAWLDALWTRFDEVLGKALVGRRP